MPRSVRLAAAALALAGLATPAFAHALLQKASPAVGATIHVAPTEIVLHFSEEVEPHFSRVEVRGPSGARVDSGDLATAPGDAKTLVKTIAASGTGAYTVEWHVTSEDTHKTQGTFTFKVAP